MVQQLLFLMTHLRVPAIFGPYMKKTEDSNGVVAMVHLLVAVMDK